eukprot:CAMPEP_0181045050 /NCGR_PEP_ID=MMETSP1070-20121207/13597_1 /TAXON_ID=265543 /ORGANISM="Minutocellus polymorphus, Strain NH13" /LENGTH=451 /DNA_ID=CAMNT_0023123545 /DNA_START=26 /DNA_END=1378 /DNA_ORIENTATION=-
MGSFSATPLHAIVSCSCALLPLVASATHFTPQHILGSRSPTSAFRADGRRHGRAELLHADRYDWETDVSIPEEGESSLDMLDANISFRDRFGLASGGDRNDDELQLALPADSSVSPDLGLSALRRLSKPMAWDVDPELLSTLIGPTDADQAKNRPIAFRKTGTTIVGCLADNGQTVVIAADTRATDGTTVADARCEKVHRVADNVWCCGAGTSGDIDALVRQCRYTFLLKGAVSDSIGTCSKGGRVSAQPGNGEDIPEQLKAWLPKVRVAAVVRMLRDVLYDSGGHVGANLVLGGYDAHESQAVLVAIHPHGSVDSVPFTALGSGGLAAISVLESRHRPDLSVEEAIQICKDAVGAGITNDLGSGSQIDLCVISPTGVTYQRAVVKEESLPVSRGERASDELLRYRNSAAESKEEVVLDGVCGFGSLPYRVLSRRVVLQDEMIKSKRRPEW